MKIIFDTETTGLDYEKDEIIQFSAIDEYGNTLINAYMKPVKVKSWHEASKVNGITPEMVAEMPEFDEYKTQIQWLFDRADELISYNGAFDIQMLEHAGITFNKDVKQYDVMKEFAPVFGEWSDYRDDYKWQKLTTCANFYGYKFKAHDSLEDVKATLFCYKKLTE